MNMVPICIVAPATDLVANTKRELELRLYMKRFNPYEVIHKLAPANKEHCR